MLDLVANNDLLNNILGTIIGGLVLTLILFGLNEFVFAKKNLTGEWITIMKIDKTSYASYENLSIEYKIHLLQKGNELIGTGEKIKDINQDGSETIFELEKRVIIEVNGYYQNRYLKKSKVYMNISEEGRRRESRSTYSLTLLNKDKLSGIFISTAANSQGGIEMSRV